ncbi:hypothetical protein HQ39_02665 [Porphyromonas sp. COT-108 OH2963]|nr:hypothetical protein HQ39_02665 [Porphyromonas sp. COT-108 OH2963]
MKSLFFIFFLGLKYSNNILDFMRDLYNNSFFIFFLLSLLSVRERFSIFIFIYSIPKNAPFFLALYFDRKGRFQNTRELLNSGCFINTNSDTC